MTVGVETFSSDSNTILNGWIIPLLEIRSHNSQLNTMRPSIILAANLHLNYQSKMKSHWTIKFKTTYQFSILEMSEKFKRP